MLQVATDDQHNSSVALRWIWQKWSELGEQYAEIPDSLRQYYVDQLAAAMADWSICGFSVHGNDNLNTDTFWLHVYSDTLPSGQLTAEMVMDIRQRTTSSIWSRVDVIQDGLSMVSFAFVPSRLPSD